MGKGREMERMNEAVQGGRWEEVGMKMREIFVPHGEIICMLLRWGSEGAVRSGCREAKVVGISPSDGHNARVWVR